MNFEKMDVWNRAVDLSCDVYKQCKRIKDYGYKDQISRAGLSVPSNIAEGLERNSIKESIQFLSFAKASCAEVYTQIVIGERIGYLTNENASSLKKECRIIAKMIGGLIKSRKEFN